VFPSKRSHLPVVTVPDGCLGSVAAVRHPICEGVVLVKGFGRMLTS
jgi:hypothetical protein